MPACGLERLLKIHFRTHEDHVDDISFLSFFCKRALRQPEQSFSQLGGLVESVNLLNGRKVRWEFCAVHQRHLDVGSRWEGNLGLRKNGKKYLVGQKDRVRIQMKRRKILKPTADDALRRIGAADPVDDPVLYVFASVIDHFDARTDFNRFKAGRQDAKKADFQ